MTRLKLEEEVLFLFLTPIIICKLDLDLDLGLLWILDWVQGDRTWDQGLTKTFLFANISERLSYIGCYKFNNEEECPCTFNQDLGLTNKLDTWDSGTKMTIGKCVRHCRGLGTSFAAIDKWICFCMNKWPLESLKESNSLCPDKCTGEPEARWNCGGFWRVSVYSIR